MNKLKNIKLNNFQLLGIKKSGNGIILFSMAIILLFIFSSNLYSKSTFSSERIKSAVTDLILSKLDNQAEIEFITVPKTVEIAEDEVNADIVFNEDLKSGLNTISLKFTKAGRLLKYVELTLRIKTLQEVWVAARILPPNTKLKASDFVLKNKSLNDAKEPLDISLLIGRESFRSIGKDEFVTKDMLTNEVLIKRGDKINIIVQSGAILVRCSGSAVQDGSAGQIIRVKRDNSPSVLSGKIDDNGNVVVFSNNYSAN